QIWSSLGQTRRRLVQMREDDRELALTVERPLSGQAFEEDAAERVLIRAAVDRSTFDLLRRHIIDRADEAALARQAADGRDVTSQAEVADVRVLAVADRLCADRKSTRLNSSHVAISYAVFCLKKKKPGYCR